MLNCCCGGLTFMESTSFHQIINLDEDKSVKDIKRDQGSGSDKKKKQFSDVWGSFIKKGVGLDGIERAECKGCKKIYKCGGIHYGTSTLRRHIQNCKHIKFEDVGQMLIDYEGKLRSRKIDQKVVRDLLAAAVIKHDLPFSFVEYDGIRRLMKYLNPDAAFITRDTLISDVKRMKSNEKDKDKHKQHEEGASNKTTLSEDGSDVMEIIDEEAEDQEGGEDVFG